MTRTMRRMRVRWLVLSGLSLLNTLIVLFAMFGLWQYRDAARQVITLTPTAEVAIRDSQYLAAVPRSADPPCDDRTFSQVDDLSEDLDALVAARDRLLFRPDTCSQTAGLGAGVQVLDGVVEALGTGDLRAGDLVGYLKVAEGFGWQQKMREKVRTCIEDTGTPLTWLVDGYGGALCLRFVRGILLAVESPPSDGGTAQIIRRECASAFPGADLLCSRVEDDELVLINLVDTRRGYLRTLEDLRRVIECAACRQSEGLGALLGNSVL